MPKRHTTLLCICLLLAASTTCSKPKPTPSPTKPAIPSGPQLGGCPAFPTTHPLNSPIDTAPILPNSTAMIAAIGLHSIQPDFDAHLESPNGIPYNIVPANQPLVPITFTEYPDESDPGPYPIPDMPLIEGLPGVEGDNHILVVQQGECILYELYHAQKTAVGWNAGSGAKWDLTTGKERPIGWTSADAAGLPIAPLLVRYDEVEAGQIAHALRVTVPKSQQAFIPPASHYASPSTNPNLPPMGQRLRLKASYDISGLPHQARVIAQALKQYGLIVADNGPAWEFQGNPDPRWDDDQIQTLRTIPASAFEAVYTGDPQN